VQEINSRQFNITNAKAAFGEISPAGISRIFVLGLAASISRSSHLLKAIAALRANTMQSTTKTNFIQLISPPATVVPMKKPTIAKGMAKMV
jgi:hypothetical protein